MGRRRNHTPRDILRRVSARRGGVHVSPLPYVNKTRLVIASVRLNFSSTPVHGNTRHRAVDHFMQSTPCSVDHTTALPYEKKMSKAGKRTIRSARQALAFARGEKEHSCIVHIPKEINVRRIRRKAAMSQTEFASHFGVSVRTVQDWEQGRRVPSGVSRAFLLVIDREPEAVRRALTAN